jgi:predicted RNA polymerase sigma factor
MLATAPQDQMLRYMLAMECDKDAEPGRSLELFGSLMTDAQPYVPAFLMAGQLLARLQRVSEAREVYRSGIREAGAQGNSHAESEMTGFLEALQDSV